MQVQKPYVAHTSQLPGNFLYSRCFLLTLDPDLIMCAFSDITLTNLKRRYVVLRMRIPNCHQDTWAILTIPGSNLKCKKMRSF